MVNGDGIRLWRSGGGGERCAAEAGVAGAVEEGDEFFEVGNGYVG